MTSLLLHAGQTVLLKLFFEIRDGSWASRKVLLWDSIKQKSNKISLTWLSEQAFPFRSRVLFFLTGAIS